MTDLYEAGDINQSEGADDIDVDDDSTTVDDIDDEVGDGQRGRATRTAGRRWPC